MDVVGSETKNRNRCAACKHMRVECKSDCIFSPYFPPNDPDRFSNVHKIHGASNIKNFMQRLPPHVRAQAAETLCYEAQCRIRDPVYGCVGVVSLLLQRIQSAEMELARTKAQLAIMSWAEPAHAETVSSSTQLWHHRHQNTLLGAGAAVCSAAPAPSSFNAAVAQDQDGACQPRTCLMQGTLQEIFRAA